MKRHREKSKARFKVVFDFNDLEWTAQIFATSKDADVPREKLKYMVLQAVIGFCEKIDDGELDVTLVH